MLFASEGADRVAFRVSSDVPLSVEGGDAVARFRLRAGEPASFILEEVLAGPR